ncbi:hypothetical protein [Bryocella elongata]|uniref:hypothetical protein n=1 Tax=Bryocella elongata TaxID=863522 RepID=UPI0011B04EC7|nr:hypothetical protein [Bryocella elongata]
MSTHRGSLNTQRRFLFLYVALLCAAVFCQHSAHAAITASQPFRATPCRVKVAADAPSAQQRLRTQVRRATCPGRAAASEFWAATTPTGNLRLAGTSASDLQRHTALARLCAEIPPQLRPYSLRV